jgi:hypothetical protein
MYDPVPGRLRSFPALDGELFPVARLRPGKGGSGHIKCHQTIPLPRGSRNFSISNNWLFLRQIKANFDLIS